MDGGAAAETLGCLETKRLDEDIDDICCGVLLFVCMLLHCAAVCLHVDAVYLHVAAVCCNMLSVFCSLTALRRTMCGLDGL